MNNDFKEIPNHTGMVSKQVLGAIEGAIKDGMVARVAVRGGGPVELHTHTHNHLFILLQGELVVRRADERVVLHENESILVEGAKLHSVWNESDRECVMLVLTIEP